MAKLNVRNRNKDKTFKDGRPKPPNWEYRFEGARVGGKRNQISEAGFRTKKEAETAGTKALAAYNSAGQHFVPAEISVADFFDFWLKNYSAVNNSDNTTSGYTSIIENHIKPRLGIYKLKAVDTLTAQTFINAMAKEMGFSKKYVKSILKVLKNGFKYAHKQAKFITSNPVEDVTLPVMDVDDEDQDIIILTKEEVAAILDRFRRSPYQYYAMLIAYYTGLRVSEVYGLTWDRIDFKNKTLKVDRIAKKFDYNGKGKPNKGTSGQYQTIWYLGACKTKSSYRTIPIGDTLLNALQDYKDLQEAYKKEYGQEYIRTYAIDELTNNKRKVKRILQTNEPQKDLEELHLVCVKENGIFTGSSSMKYPSSVINKMGIKFSFHAFRHTHATMLIEQGLPIKAVSERLGHSNTKITWDVYVKVTSQMENEVVDTFEAESGLNFRDEELYSLWKQTLNKKNITYYKERNITVCEEWQEFKEFEKWANNSGWCSGMRLLRIDKTGHYEPDNCMFGTESKSVKGEYVYADGENMKSYAIRKIGRSYQYRITYYNELGKRCEANKAGFPTENDAALAAEERICDMFAEGTLQSDKVQLRLVK